MKKILLLALIILNVSLLTVYASDEKIVVNDDYEKYEIGAQPEGWTMTNDKEGGIYGDIEQDPDNPENKILVLHSNGTDVRCYRNFEDVGGFTTIECRVKLSDNGNNGVHWVASSDVFLFNMLYQRGFTIKNASVNKAIPNFVVDFTKWYDIKYELDFSNQTFNYYLNGAIVLQDSPFWIPDTMSINRIFFGINNNTICIDDFKITSKGEIEKVYTGISSSKYYIHNFNRKIWESHSDTLLSDFMPKLNFVEGAVVTVLDSDRETEYHGTYVKVFYPEITGKDVFQETQDQHLRSQRDYRGGEKSSRRRCISGRCQRGGDHRRTHCGSDRSRRGYFQTMRKYDRRYRRRHHGCGSDLLERYCSKFFY